MTFNDLNKYLEEINPWHPILFCGVDNDGFDWLIYQETLYFETQLGIGQIILN